MRKVERGSPMASIAWSAPTVFASRFPKYSYHPRSRNNTPFSIAKLFWTPEGTGLLSNFTVIAKPASVPRRRELNGKHFIHSEASLGAQPNLKGTKSSGGILESLRLCFCVAPESLLRRTEKKVPVHEGKRRKKKKEKKQTKISSIGEL
ncbi:hypothetical protein BDV41DRAFT_488191 [Aspergillus transmontanensis]|uniref:Uncharacterized protein n=1 Tax=Aspergillus transmontanensis TaxID=1034304 RepID=A0A5N6VJT9_9EURO|nr:hypothetical protein BDV41DRAFT_488191 [Aspergillus transmontanensis]